MLKREYRYSRERGILSRRVGLREIRQRFLIVCEGERTEPNYFRAFRVPGMVVEGVARQARQLVERAIELRDADEYDQVWCVFDRDDVPAGQFNEAIALADREGMYVAYSNEAFELWYLLHFHYYSTGITRHDYIQRLGKLLERQYTKNNEIMYDVLFERQPQALQRARNLLAMYDPARPVDDNPSTTVHMLVEALNQHRSGT